MKSKLPMLLLIFMLVLTVYPFESNNSTIETINLEDQITFDVEYEFSFLNSPIIYNSQVSDISDGVSIQFIMASRHSIIGYNVLSNDEIWRIQVPSEGPVIISDVKQGPSLQETFPTKFYVSLSNGTIMQINKAGEIVWSNLLKSTNSCSNINCSRSISFLANENDSENTYKIILGGDDLTVYFLNSNGSLINNFTLNSPITIIKTLNSFSAFGTKSGQLYVFNTTDSLLWNKIVSISVPVISIGMTNDIILANAWNKTMVGFNLLNGQPAGINFSINEDILSLDAIFIPEDKPADIYFSFLFGSLSKYNSNGSIIWKTSLNTNTIIDINIANISGGFNSEIVATTDVGSIFVINDTYGEIISEISAFSEQISYLSLRDINEDGFDDISVGSLSGTVKIILGKDLIPPRFITTLEYEISKSNLLYIHTLTSEETSSMLVLETEEGIKTVLLNETYRSNQTFFISQLESDKVYEIQMTIYDRYNNTNDSEKFTIRTNVIIETPWDLYFGGLVVIISLGASSYLLLTFILKKRYLNLAENSIKLGDYSKAIKLFYKAKNQEKIIETVKVILNNPELASKMNEIAQAAELEDYMSEIYDLIAQEG